jgi:hypothetical protein
MFNRVVALLFCAYVGIPAYAANSQGPDVAFYQGYEIAPDYVRREYFAISADGSDVGGHAMYSGIKFCPASSGWFCMSGTIGHDVAFPLRSTVPSECWTFMGSRFTVQSVAFDISSTSPTFRLSRSGIDIETFVVRQSMGNTQRVYFYTPKDGIFGYTETLLTRVEPALSERFDFWHMSGPLLGGDAFRRATPTRSLLTTKELKVAGPQACDMPANQPLHPTPTAAEAPASGAGERRR